MPTKRIWRFRFGYFPNDARCWVPRVGVLNTRAEDAIASFWLAEDGELSVYVYWICFEVALKLKTRPAKGIKGVITNAD